MKRFTSLVSSLVIAIVAVTLTSCKKDEVEAASPSLQGYWVGKYGGLTNYPTNFFAFVIKADGTAKVYADGSDTASSAKGAGNYTFIDNKFNITYTYPGSGTVLNVTATTTSGFTMMEGTWGTGASYSNSGRFFMGKQ